MPKRRSLILTGVALLAPLGLLVASTVGAQPATFAAPTLANVIDAELEGVVTSIIDLGQSTEIIVLGVPVIIDDDTLIETPSAQITRGDLLGSSLPGRSAPGFWSASAIVIGQDDAGVVYADVLLIEPSESVLAGPSTEAHEFPIPGPSILGVPVVILEDPRMPGIAMNELGFEIDPATIEIGVFGVAEGYLGEDGIFYAHLVQAQGTIVGPPNQTSITRARCSQSVNVDIRGGSTTPVGIVTLFDDDTDEMLAQILIEEDADLPGVGTYRFDLELEQCPERIRVENSNDSMAVADVITR